MAVLELEGDPATAAPVRRPRRVGVLFIGSVAWIALIGLAAIFADWLPIQSPTDIDFLAKRAAPFMITADHHPHRLVELIEECRAADVDIDRIGKANLQFAHLLRAGDDNRVVARRSGIEERYRVEA